MFFNESHDSISDDMKPSNVGLEQEAQLSRGWKGAIHGTNGKKVRNGGHQYPPTIKYLHLHECDRFSVSNFFNDLLILWVNSLQEMYALSGLSAILFFVMNFMISSHPWFL